MFGDLLFLLGDLLLGVGLDLLLQFGNTFAAFLELLLESFQLTPQKNLARIGEGSSRGVSQQLVERCSQSSSVS